MLDAAPFRAVRYDPDVAGDARATSAPAYDAVEPLAYAGHREASPYTVLELHAPDGAHRRAASLYRSWRRQGALVDDVSPALYRYEIHELVAGVPTAQRGLLAAVRLGPLDGTAGILPHEDVDTARVAARLRRLTELPVELTPVHALLVGAPPALTERLAAPPPSAPIVAMTDADGADHRVWALRDPDEQATLAAALAETRAIIADGHHRWARSLAHRDAQRAAHPDAGSEAPFERALVYLADPADGVRVEAVHRLLRPLGRRSLAGLEEHFHLERAAVGPAALARWVSAEPAGVMGLLAPDGTAWLLRPRHRATLVAQLPSARRWAWRDVDAALLEHAILPSLALPAGAVHPRADLRRAAAEVSARDDAALLVVRPVPLPRVLDLAVDGQRLPPKTTRIAPKPRAGLLLRSAEAEQAPA